MAVERVGLVLRQHDDPQVAAVDDVGEREVDQPVDPRERHRRLRPVGGQRHQPLSLTTGQDDGQDPLATGGAHARTVATQPVVEEVPPTRWLRSELCERLETDLAARDGRSRDRRQGAFLNSDRDRSVRAVRVDILTKEYPPAIYGGAGVHVAELVRALRGLPGARRPGAGVRRAARRGRRVVVRRPAGARGRQRRAADPRRRPRDRGRLRRRRPGALAHLVRQPRRPPRRPAVRRARTSSPPTRSSRCGRGRPSSSVVGTPCRRSPSARRTSARRR